MSDDNSIVEWYDPDTYYSHDGDELNLMTIRELLDEYPVHEWDNVFGEKRNSVISHIDKLLAQKIKSNCMYCPDNRDIFNIYRYLMPYEVKVVILGQDPYHDCNDDGEPKAMGVAFANRIGDPINPSLRNIFEVVHKTTGKCGADSTLLHWIQQGVFLLNCSLTVNRDNSKVKKNNANSHRGTWREIVTRTLQEIVKHNPNVVFMLWGNDSQADVKGIAIKSTHKLTASHPSPLGYAKTAEPFRDCDHFNEANELLIEAGLEPIDW